MQTPNRITRRRLLASGAGAALGLGLAGVAAAVPGASEARLPVVARSGLLTGATLVPSRVRAVDASGNRYVLGRNAFQLSRQTAAGITQWMVGSAGAATSQFSGIQTVQVDQANNRLLILDTVLRRVVVYSTAGVFQSVLVGSGLAGPTDMVLAGSELYVADGAGHRIVVFNAATGAQLRTWGSFDAQNFNNPRSLAVAPDGQVHVLFTGANLVRVYTGTGTAVTTYSGTGSGPGQQRLARNIAILPNGRRYVSDLARNLVNVFDSGNQPIGVINVRSASRLDSPVDLIAGDDGNLYIAAAPGRRLS